MELEFRIGQHSISAILDDMGNVTALEIEDDEGKVCKPDFNTIQHLLGHIESERQNILYNTRAQGPLMGRQQLQQLGGV